jgi:hypothetical protein
MPRLRDVVFDGDLSRYEKKAPHSERLRNGCFGEKKRLQAQEQEPAMNKKKTRRPSDPKTERLPAPGDYPQNSQTVRRREKSCLTCSRQLRSIRLPTSPWVH